MRVTPEHIEHAVWTGTTVAVAVAAVLTPFIWRVRRWIARVTGQSLLAGFVALLLAFAAYVVSTLVFSVVVNAELRDVSPTASGTTLSWARVFVHPGVLHKLSPMIAIVITWVVLEMREARYATRAAG